MPKEHPEPITAPQVGGDKPAWHVLTLAQSIAAIRQQFQALTSSRAQQGLPPVDYFLPTCYMRVNRFGRQVLAQRKMLFTYLFVRDTAAGLRDIRTRIPGLRMLTVHDSHTGQRRYMTITDRDMESFRTIANAHSGELPCYRVGDIDLQAGDRVQVIGGPFSGVEGTLRTAPGRDGGQVVLAIGDLFIVSTGDIQSQYIRILQFGHGNRHPYKQFEAHQPRALAALAAHLRHQPLAVDDLTAMQVFVQRYQLLQPDTPNLAATHAALMLITTTALQLAPQREHWLAQCRSLLPGITAPQQRAMLQAMLYAATGDPQLAQTLQATIASWQPIKPAEAKKRTIATILAQFQPLHANGAD